MDQFFRMKIGVFADSYLNIQSGAKARRHACVFSCQKPLNQQTAPLQQAATAFSFESSNTTKNSN